MGQTGQKKRAQRGGAMRSLGDWIGTYGLLQVLLEERRDLVERDLLHVVVEVRVVGTRDDHEFFVRTLELLESTLAEVARMGFLAVDDEHRTLDLTGVGEQRHVHE